VIHERHFTVAEADAALGEVGPLLERLREARDRLTDAEAHEALAEASPTNGGGRHGHAVGGAFLEVRRLLATLSALGVVLRDIDRGLVDFPALLDGREIYLCWQRGEARIGFWHELESGYEGRRPLD